MSNEHLVSQEQLLYMHPCKNYNSEKVSPMAPDKTFCKTAILSPMSLSLMAWLDSASSGYTEVCFFSVYTEAQFCSAEAQFCSAEMSRTAKGIDIGFLHLVDKRVLHSVYLPEFRFSTSIPVKMPVLSKMSVFSMNILQGLVFLNKHKFAFRLRQNLLNMDVNDSKHPVHYFNP